MLCAILIINQKYSNPIRHYWDSLCRVFFQNGARLDGALAFQNESRYPKWKLLTHSCYCFIRLCISNFHHVLILKWPLWGKGVLKCRNRLHWLVKLAVRSLYEFELSLIRGITLNQISKYSKISRQVTALPHFIEISGPLSDGLSSRSTISTLLVSGEGREVAWRYSIRKNFWIFTLKLATCQLGWNFPWNKRRLRVT